MASGISNDSAEIRSVGFVHLHDIPHIICITTGYFSSKRLKAGRHICVANYQSFIDLRSFTGVFFIGQTIEKDFDAIIQ